MRVFQIGNLYPAHLARLAHGLDRIDDFYDIRQAILEDVPQAQLLDPCVKSDDPTGMLCFPQYGRGLRLWASQKGMPEKASEDDILLAMIEDHRTEVFYSINATHHSADLLRRMPGTVRLKLAWLGTAFVSEALSCFDAVVSNFPNLNAGHEKAGMTSYYLTPSYETQADSSAAMPWRERTTDVFFAGTYSRHHTARAAMVDAMARRMASDDRRFDLRLLNSRFTPLAEKTPLGLFPPFSRVKRPPYVRRFAQPPVFGRQMFDCLARSKIVLNMAIDIAGSDRGNMRCFEAMSSGALMISDVGDYPDGFENGKTHLTYSNIDQALELADHFLTEPEEAAVIADHGAAMMRKRYSKARQWSDFENLCARI